MAKYVVTGGAGFIGSHLVDDLLERGHTVRVVDDISTGQRQHVDTRADLIVGDVADAALMRRMLADADGCFHLAAVASVARANADWLGAHRTNLTGTITVLDAARQAGGIPVVFASSAAVYGRQDDAETAKLHEGLPCMPLSAYGADKLGAEMHARTGFTVHGVPSVGLRFFNVYGPRQDPRSAYSGVISIFADRIARRLPVTIEGDGRQTRDFVYVGDVVRHLTSAMVLLGRTPQSAVFNVCSGRETSVLDLAETIASLCGRSAQIRFAPSRPGDIRTSVGNPSAARQALGVAALTSLENGLEALLAIPPARRLRAAA